MPNSKGKKWYDLYCLGLTYRDIADLERGVSGEDYSRNVIAGAIRRYRVARGLPPADQQRIPVMTRKAVAS